MNYWNTFKEYTFYRNALSKLLNVRAATIVNLLQGSLIYFWHCQTLHILKIAKIIETFVTTGCCDQMQSQGFSYFYYLCHEQIYTEHLGGSVKVQIWPTGREGEREREKKERYCERERICVIVCEWAGVNARHLVGTSE